MAEMGEKIRTVALIPARGNSKRLPRKNMRMLADQPLLGYSIDAATKAANVDAVYVSTEDLEIAAFARLRGANVIDRPQSLASDTAQNDAVIRHAIEAIGVNGVRPEIVLLLQPTSPFRTASDVRSFVDGFLASDAKSGMSVCPVDHHPGKAIRLVDGHIEPFTTDGDMESRHQDLPSVLRQNGAIYGVRVADFLASGRFYIRPCFAFVMTREKSLDIDDAFDFALAEFMFAKRENPR